MADSGKVPYLAAHGNITRALEGIRAASIPDKFTQDFLSAKLGLTGGGARPVIPFLKRAGFLNSDGSPSDLYRRFKNSSAAPAAAAEAMRKAYAALYEVNEYAHELSDDRLKGLILQVTGLESDSSLIRAMVGSFKALKAFADFDAPTTTATAHVEDRHEEIRAEPAPAGTTGSARTIRLGYNINLNLPATSDIAVFNAIFKSLREHLLQ